MPTVSDIFKIVTGVAVSDLNVSEKPRNSRYFPVVRPSHSFQKVIAGFLDSDEVPASKLFPPDTLVVSTDGQGSHSYSYVIPHRFIPNSNVSVLLPLKTMSLKSKLFYSLAITQSRWRFSYGRKPKGKRLETIKMPPVPSWVESVTTDLCAGKDASLGDGPSRALDVSSWRPFCLSNLFDIKKGRRLTKAKMKAGKTPFVGSIDKNNGVSGFVGQQPIHRGNTITVNYNGSVAEAFYQPSDFWASDDVNVLYPRFQLNPAIAAFLITVIRREQYRFTYGRKWHLERMRAAEIKLPVCCDGRPDWGLMERFIGSLPFSSQLQ